MILVDTSVLVDYFRGLDTPATVRLDRLETEASPFAIPGICCQEVLQGAGDEVGRSRGRVPDQVLTLHLWLLHNGGEQEE